MSNSERLSKVQINIGGGKALTEISNKMDVLIMDCVKEVQSYLLTKYNNEITLKHSNDIKLKDIVSKLKTLYPNEEWTYKFDTSAMKPDGGILYIIDNNNKMYPILIVEQKKQGTNDRVIATTGKKQASGNAIERLGKNVIGFRTWMKNEAIFPFVCFGYGWDFNLNSSILDRVITIAEFGKLNQTNLYNTEQTNRGSFYFNEHPLTKNQILAIIKDIAERSVQYYFSKYGESNFKK